MKAVGFWRRTIRLLGLHHTRLRLDFITEKGRLSCDGRKGLAVTPGRPSASLVSVWSSSSNTRRRKHISTVSKCSKLYCQIPSSHETKNSGLRNSKKQFGLLFYFFFFFFNGITINNPDNERQAARSQNLRSLLSRQLSCGF